jgi:hypothetical protein
VIRHLSPQGLGVRSTPRQTLSIVLSVLAASAVTLGILVRVVQWFFNRSLWLDEIGLAQTLFERSYAGLFQPLGDMQSAPPAFLVVSKGLTQVMGTDEQVLRAVPLLAGISSLYLFHVLARKWLPRDRALGALAVFALLHPLIYYSTEFKPYSSDVTVTLGLYLIALHYDRRNLTPSAALTFGAIGAAALWWSFPSVFVLAGIGAALGMSAVWRRDWRRAALLATSFAFWVSSFSLYYLLILRTASQDPELAEFWQSAFMPLPAGLDTLEWLYRNVAPMFANPGGFDRSGLAGWLCLLGCAALLFKDRKKLAFLVLPFCFVLIASAFEKYPFRERLLLFLVPSMLLLIIEGIGAIQEKVGRYGPIIAVVLLGVLGYGPVRLAGYHVSHPVWREETKPVLAYIRSNWQKGDRMYVYYAGRRSFWYYGPAFGFGPEDAVIGSESRKDLEVYRRELDRFKGEQRVWIYFAHILAREEAFIVSHLNSLGVQKLFYEATDAKAYLYDCRASPGRN